MISIDNIVDVLKEKNPQAVDDVIKAYAMAEVAHQGVFRESGEPYITHPLTVARNLLNMEIYDKDTICAALLHDTVEDCDDISLEDISKIINPEVAELVDGVTKMRRMNFSTKKEQNDANTRKIITGLTKDVRIILIKLADRLHNMTTLDFKRPQKQKENAIETMELFVPLALSIGAYQVKNVLEDLSLQYIDPEEYKRIKEGKEALAETEEAYLKEMSYKISEILKQKDIPVEIILRTQTINTLYKKIKKGYQLENIYDLFYLKLLVNEIDDCYRTLSYIHRKYPPINGRFKDYIWNPRTNFYQSLHTTVSDMNGKLTKVKIRTFDMNRVAAYGIPAYWNIDPNKPEEEIPLRRTQEETQREVRDSLQFAKKLQEIDGAFSENADFIETVKQELLTDHVYVYKHSGEIIELPQGSTALDFACQVYPELLDIMTGVIVNGKEVPVNTVLKNNDRVQVNTKGIINHDSWADSVTTVKGKQKIYRLTGQTSI